MNYFGELDQGTFLDIDDKAAYLQETQHQGRGPVRCCQGWTSDQDIVQEGMLQMDALQPESGYDDYHCLCKDYGGGGLAKQEHPVLIVPVVSKLYKSAVAFSDRNMEACIH